MAEQSNGQPPSYDELNYGGLYGELEDALSPHSFGTTDASSTQIEPPRAEECESVDSISSSQAKKKRVSVLNVY